MLSGWHPCDAAWRGTNDRRALSSARSIRAFVAFELPAGLQGRVAALVASLEPRPEFARIRWAAPDGVHLTLRFLGNALPEQLQKLEPPLRLAAERTPRAQAHFESLGLFPHHGSPRVLWLNVRLAPAVLALQETCERAAVAAGFLAEGRRFRPHLTLGRWRARVRRPSLPPASLAPAVLDTLAVFQSELRSSGARYTPLLRIPLG